MTLEGKVIPTPTLKALDKIKDKIKFEVSVHNTAEIEWWTDSPNGSVTFWADRTDVFTCDLTVKNMPERNSDFNTGTAYIKSGDSKTEAVTKFQTFYRLRGTHNPASMPIGNGSKRPVNIVLYYSDALNLHHADMKIRDELADGYLSRYKGYFPQDNIYNNQFWFVAGVDASNYANITWSGVNHGNEYFYMEAYRWAFYHEKKHYSSLTDWWGLPTECHEALTLRNQRNPESKDLDGDRIPDKYEIIEEKEYDWWPELRPALEHLTDANGNVLNYKTQQGITFDNYLDFEHYVEHNVPSLPPVNLNNENNVIIKQDFGASGSQYGDSI